jgi:uncharacterized repeat protein (TIGR02543 family)
LNGGRGVSSETYNADILPFTLSESAINTGYTFKGWYDNSNLLGDPLVAIPVGTIGNREY